MSLTIKQLLQADGWWAVVPDDESKSFDLIRLSAWAVVAHVTLDDEIRGVDGETQTVLDDEVETYVYGESEKEALKEYQQWLKQRPKPQDDR